MISGRERYVTKRDVDLSGALVNDRGGRQDRTVDCDPVTRCGESAEKDEVGAGNGGTLCPCIARGVEAIDTG